MDLLTRWHMNVLLGESSVFALFPVRRQLTAPRPRRGAALSRNRAWNRFPFTLTIVIMAWGDMMEAQTLT